MKIDTADETSRWVVRLPNHPSQTTRDPLGLSDDTEDEDGNVPFYPILLKLCHAEQVYDRDFVVSDFISIMEEISYTMGFAADPDISLLKECVTKSMSILKNTFPLQIYGYASDLEKYWPAGELDILRPGKPKIYTFRELRCLTALQFLGALEKPPWNDWGGVNLGPVWYRGKINTTIKTSYINIVLDYLFANAKHATGSNLKFTLHEEFDFPNLVELDRPMMPLKIVELAEEDDYPPIARPKNATHDIIVISSHHLIGHGPGGTQEERILASYPELLPVSLFTPPLTSTSALYVSSAGQPLLPRCRFNGHGRTARIEERFSDVDRYGLLHGTALKETGFLCIDAAELDVERVEEGKLADFKPGMLERDFRKAYTGFRACIKDQASQEHSQYRIIVTPWGTGAFGGDIRVKLLLLWLAASAAARGSEVELIFLVKRGVLGECESEAVLKLKALASGALIVKDVWSALLDTRKDNYSKSAIDDYSRHKAERIDRDVLASISKRLL